LLRKGGYFAIIDVNPEAIKKMPGFAYVLFKSTEPDMDDYLKLDLVDSLGQAGFSGVIMDDSIHRRLVTVASK
jgi:Holliday junction resolvase RusA-like endonuclease